MTTNPLAGLIAKTSDADLQYTVLPDGSSVLLDISGHRVLTLSDTGTYLMQQLRDGTATVDMLAKRLTQEFDVDDDTARRDTQEFVDALSAALAVRSAG